MLRFLFLATLFTLASAGNVYLFGDSITWNMYLCNNFKLFDPPYNVMNYAVPSQNINGVQQQLLNLKTQPDVLVITVGFKDLIHDLDTPVSYHINKYSNMINIIREIFPNTIVLVHSILPTGSLNFSEEYSTYFLNMMRTYNQGLYEIVKPLPSNFRFVNTFPLFLKNGQVNEDLYFLENMQWVHPNCNGYQLWKLETNRIFDQFIENQPTEKPEHKSLSSSPQSLSSVSGSMSSSGGSVSSSPKSSASGSIASTPTPTPTPYPPTPTPYFSPSVSSSPSPSPSATASPDYKLTVSASPSISESPSEITITSSATKNIIGWSVLLIALFLF